MQAWGGLSSTDQRDLFQLGLWREGGKEIERERAFSALPVFLILFLCPVQLHDVILKSGLAPAARQWVQWEAEPRL